MKKTILKRHVYYVAILKSNNKVLITLTKTALSEFIGVSHDTITRHLKNSSSYITDEFIVWKDIPIERVRRGFALKKNYNNLFK